MRILFTVQGEGRGHLTQAIAAWEMLSRWGHELVGVIAGSNPTRELPQFFTHAFPLPVVRLPSPGFILSANRGVNLPATLWHAVRQPGTWRTSLEQLRQLIDQARPDLVINFFEPLTGLLQGVRPLPVPVLAVAHQFALLSPNRVELPERRQEQWWLRAFINLVGYRSWRLALSFTPGPDPTGYRLLNSPPLLRRSVTRLKTTTGTYVLVYLLNHGYADRVRDWHRRNPNVPLHCFYDRPDAPPVDVVDPTLSFHRLDGEKFLCLMASCRAVMCTAGFESVCEAAFLGKPVLMVPVEHHLEQMLNARDGEQAGLGLSHPVFDLDAIRCLPQQVNTSWFQEWCSQAEAYLARAIDRVTGTGAFASPGRAATL